jgi:hypothetical protein
MVTKKISPKVQLAAEKYLALLGSSKEQLTDRQWQVVINYVKSQSVAKLAITFLLIFCILTAYLSFWAFKLGQKGINSIVPNQTAEIILISKSGEKSQPIKPDEMKNYTKAIAKLYWHHGAEFVMAMFMLSLVILSFVERRAKRKMLEAFIPRAGESQTTSPENK